MTVRKHPDRDVYGDNYLRESSSAYNLQADDEDDLTGWDRPTKEFPRQGHYTIDDYAKLPENRRFELIDGVLIELFAPSLLHQAIVQLLWHQLYHCIKESGEDCDAFLAATDVRLDRDNRTMVQPDVFVVCRYGPFKTRWIEGAPDFAIEVLSPFNIGYDKVLKFNKYKNAGVREYWIIDPMHRKIFVYNFENNEPEKVYPFESIIEVGISRGKCRIDFEEISREIAKFLET